MSIGRRQFLQLATGAAVLPVSPRVRARRPIRPGRSRWWCRSRPGGANDTTARLVAQKLSEHLGQQFYCENQVGAGGNIAFAATAKAPKDGYTILAAGGNFVINPSLYARVPYDPFKDFAPVSLMCSSPHVVAVNPSVPAANMQELVALLEGQSGQVQLRLGGPGNAGASRRRAVPARLSASTSPTCRSAAAGRR